MRRLSPTRADCLRAAQRRGSLLCSAPVSLTHKQDALFWVTGWCRHNTDGAASPHLSCVMCKHYYTNQLLGSDGCFTLLNLSDLHFCVRVCVFKADCIFTRHEFHLLSTTCCTGRRHEKCGASRQREQRTRESAGVKT